MPIFSNSTSNTAHKPMLFGNVTFPIGGAAATASTANAVALFMNSSGCVRQPRIQHRLEGGGAAAPPPPPPHSYEMLPSGTNCCPPPPLPTYYHARVHKRRSSYGKQPPPPPPPRFSYQAQNGQHPPPHPRSAVSLFLLLSRHCFPPSPIPPPTLPQPSPTQSRMCVHV